jgi:hypothetical protein
VVKTHDQRRDAHCLLAASLLIVSWAGRRRRDDFDAPRAGGTLGTTKSIFSVLGPGKSILLGMPGAYTPTCNDVHLPGFYSLAPGNCCERAGHSGGPHERVAR